MKSAGAASRTGNPGEGNSAMRLSVIVPARNEADVLRPCLESLLVQSEEGFAVGDDWELLLVDDGSTDATRSIALAFAGVTVLDPAPLEAGWTGKANAVWTAAKKARGEWLLFTDADTVHQAGDLRRAIHEAEHAHVVMLSYSPKQLVTGFWQRALMPLIFAELAFAYPPQKVSDAGSRVAAANGQFLMVQKAAYFQVGGHSTVAGSLLEDVDLAFLLKRHDVSQL
jgi:glycosyltransferase involved in cell wall biosynthesis